MREPESADPASAEPVLPPDFDDPLDEEEFEEESGTSYAVLLILAVGGFGIGMLLLGITFSTASVLQEYVGEMGWLIAPLPLLVFGVAGIAQFELPWLQRLGAAAVGFSLAQFVMMAIGMSVLTI